MRNAFIKITGLTGMIIMCSAVASYAADATVVHPVTGESVQVSTIDFSELTRAQRRDIGDQLADQGLRLERRPARQAPLVTDPFTGDQVPLNQVDIDRLTDEQRQAIRDELRENRPERPERGDRPQRAERPDRGDRPDRADRPERGDRPRG
jgi:hypothetical protein